MVGGQASPGLACAEACDDAGITDLLGWLRDIDELDEPYRTSHLAKWANAEPMLSLYMISEGDLGRLSRAALKALYVEAEADTPAKCWDRAGHIAARASIDRLLSLPDRSPMFASFPFRAIEDDGRSWIGGAVGCPSPPRWLEERWPRLLITDVILWDPRSGDVRLMGEHWSVPALIAPEGQHETLAVYSDGLSFFRDWAARRLATAELMRKRARGTWLHPIVEPTDGGLPGALAIGDVDRLPINNLPARELVAGPGTSFHDLRRGLFRSANLPRVNQA